MLKLRKILEYTAFTVAVVAVSWFVINDPEVKEFMFPPTAQVQVEEPVNIYGGISSQLAPDDVKPTGDEAMIVVQSQETGVVGELIRFDVSQSVADSFKWLLVPESVDFEVYDSGKRAVFSARQPGDYMFVVACAYKGTVDVTTHVVMVEGKVPDDPDDPVEPGVYPVVPKPDASAELDEWIPYWCAQAECPKNEAQQLAGSFESVAAMVSAGVYTTPQEIIQATGEANREALGSRLQAWVPVLRGLQDEFQQMSQDGLLTTPEQHAKTWRAVADALNGYASLFATTE